MTILSGNEIFQFRNHGHDLKAFNFQVGAITPVAGASERIKFYKLFVDSFYFIR